MEDFKSRFKEPVYFSDGSYVLSGEYSIEEAAVFFSEALGEEIKQSDIKKDFVRFGILPEDVDHRDEVGRSWYTGAKDGRGSKAVWVIGN